MGIPTFFKSLIQYFDVKEISKMLLNYNHRHCLPFAEELPDKDDVY
ncbi:hypothetical protein [Crocosphaera sp. Alani8]